MSNEQTSRHSIASHRGRWCSNDSKRINFFFLNVYMQTHFDMNKNIVHWNGFKPFWNIGLILPIVMVYVITSSSTTQHTAITFYSLFDEHLFRLPSNFTCSLYSMIFKRHDHIILDLSTALHPSAARILPILIALYSQRLFFLLLLLLLWFFLWPAFLLCRFK